MVCDILIPPYNNRQHSFNSLAVEPLTAASESRCGGIATFAIFTYFKLAAAILLHANRCMHIDGCHKHITGNSGYRVSALSEVGIVSLVPECRCDGSCIPVNVIKIFT